MANAPVTIRPAVAGDVDAMGRLLAEFAAQKLLLARSRDDLFAHLQEFLVAEQQGECVGMVALHIYDQSLAELRSLATARAMQRQGVGRRLVTASEAWARRLGIGRIFALTYVDRFFVNQGYRVVAKESLPHKVWTVCIHCDRFAHCDEVAVEKRLTAPE